jgi:hypothetical protein
VIEQKRIWERHPLTTVYAGVVLVALLVQVVAGWWLA